MKRELVLEIIRERWSPYSFSQNPVEDYKLKAMFEASGYAPSCNNEQPWVFVFVTRKNNRVFDDFLEFLPDQDRKWARDAYILVVAMARTSYGESGKVNRHALYDTGMAVGNLLIQALTMDLYVHQIEEFSVEKVKDYFRDQDGIEPVSVMAVGYLGDGMSLTPELQEEDEHRRPKKFVNEFTFSEVMYNPAF